MIELAPTPLTLAASVSREVGREVWVKRDDLTHPRYGGNKVRKLRVLLDDAVARGATDVITVGAAGSHHCLATAVHARALGLGVELVLMPQARTTHARDNLRAVVGLGARVHPVSGYAGLYAKALARAAALRAEGRRAYVIPIGGSNPLGATGYLDAARELFAERPDGFDVTVCALGSGGTHAGLAAGFAACGARGALWGVRVTPLPGARALVWALANAALRRRRLDARVRLADVRVLEGQLGEAYGRATAAGDEATARFARDGVTLDPTYTAKAAAGLLALAPTTPAGARLLFWQTLSSAPMGPLLEGAPEALPAALEALLVP